MTAYVWTISGYELLLIFIKNVLCGLCYVSLCWKNIEGGLNTRFGVAIRLVTSILAVLCVIGMSG